MNDASRRTLGPLGQYLPVATDLMIGTSIDVFHKNPSHQRRMLADASRLPHRTRIKLGPELLDLQVSAIMGPDGTYLGPMLTWAVVTAQATMASDVSQVVTAMSGAVEEMQRSANGLGRSADEARDRAATVAAGSEEMTASIQEIPARSAASPSAPSRSPPRPRRPTPRCAASRPRRGRSIRSSA